MLRGVSPWAFFLAQILPPEASPLPKKDVLSGLVLFGRCPFFRRQRAACNHARPGADRIQPARHMRRCLQIMLLPLPKGRPSPDRHIRDRVEIACDECMPLQLFIQNAIKPRHLRSVTVLGVGQVIGRVHQGRVFQEVMRLPRHRSKSAHLPHKPLIHAKLLALGRAIKPPRLAGEVLQDRS